MMMNNISQMVAALLSATGLAASAQSVEKWTL